VVVAVVTTTVDESVVEKSERTVHWYPCLPRPHRKPLHSPQNVGWRKNLQCDDAIGTGVNRREHIAQSGASDSWTHCMGALRCSQLALAALSSPHATPPPQWHMIRMRASKHHSKERHVTVRVTRARSTRCCELALWRREYTQVRACRR
jgi:hypothetical protein